MGDFIFDHHTFPLEMLEVIEMKVDLEPVPEFLSQTTCRI